MHQTGTVSQLRCESMINPVGIDIRAPRFSWVFLSDRRGSRQTAYQLVVFTEEGEQWNTGKRSSGQSVHVVYEGPQLRSRQRCNWRVKIWDERGEATGWSDTAFWEMGLLEPEDWQACWIEPAQLPVPEEPPMNFYDRTKGLFPTDYSRLHPCPLLRKRFAVEKPVAQARIYATAHGIYELQLNGRKAGDQELAPEMTAYDRYLQVHTYDVTELLQQGDNVIGAILSDGWYAGRVGLMGDNCQYGDKLALLLQLEILYADGSRQIIGSDHTFRSSTGPYIYADLFIGERYDARLEKAGWHLPEYDDGDWTPAAEAGRNGVSGSGGEHSAGSSVGRNENGSEFGRDSGAGGNKYDYGVLKAAYGEPVRAVKEIAPVAVLTTPKGETIVDFGQVIAGRVRMRVRGSESGREITLEHSEVLDEEGNFLNNIRGRYKDQKDVYVAKGARQEVYEPKFTFHGFRYMKVTGYPGNVALDDFTGIVLSSAMQQSGSFQCSDERLNRLQANIVWSQLGNMLSIPTDCPQRERAGWTGDIQVFAPTACFNMDVNAFLTRWLRNVALEQLEDGQVPIVVPYMKGYADIAHLMNTDSSAGWGDACIIVPWVLYSRYGDKRVLEENYTAMVRWMSYIERSASAEAELAGTGEKEGSAAEQKERQRYLWNSGFHFGDWLIPSMSVSKDGREVDMMQSAFATKELVSTCFYAYSADLLSRIADVLGRAEESRYYRELNGKVRQAFSDEYLDASGRLKAHFQGIYVLALQMNMVPDGARSRVLKQLTGLIRDNGNRLDTGFLSVPFLLDVLWDNGQRDLAYELLFQTDCPSWLYEVEHGATTIWEAWQAIMPDGKVTNVSYNHYAFGCVGDWMYRRIAGLDCGDPGYRHIIVHPAIDCGLTYAEASYDSVYGTIVSDWSIQGQTVEQRVVVPPNTTATITLPGARIADVMEGGRAVAAGSGKESIPGILHAAEQGAGVVIEADSGQYLFTYTLRE